jgi:prepilin-type N-terminal cleavage/methylation domain-containing protein
MPSRRGLSLIELLVAVAVLVLVSGLALRGLAGVTASDPRHVANQLQSRLQGLRERARQSGRPAAVRLVRDAQSPHLVVAIAGLTPGQRLSYGGSPAPVQFERDPAQGTTTVAVPVTRVRGLTPACDWLGLHERGHLRLPARMRIPAGTGEWYSVTRLISVPGQPGETVAELATPLDPGLVLQPPPAVVAIPAGSPLATCELETAAAWSAGSEPITLPANIVIDLRSSRLPEGWLAGATDLDLTWQPRGEVVEVGQHPLVLVLRPRHDAQRGLDPASADCAGVAEGLVLWPGSGRVGVYPLDTTDTKNNETGAEGPDGLADDLFRFALAAPGGES